MYHKWCDNLESDLISKNNRIYDDDQPGPSGIIVTRVKEIIKINEPPRDGQKNVNDDDIDSVAEVKETSPYQIFAEKVTIAGLEEAYNAPIRPVQIMFRIALVIAFAMIVYQAIGIVGQHMDEGTIFVDMELINYQAAFPSIFICLKPKWDDDSLGRLQNMLPFRISERIKKLNQTDDEIKNFLKKTIALEAKASDMRTNTYLATRIVFDEIVKLIEKQNKSFLLELMHKNCSKIFSNCAFNGRVFNCCKQFQFGFAFTYFAYEIKVDDIINASMIQKVDPLRIEDTGLTFDISTDWTNNYDSDGNGSDGYNIFVNNMPDLRKVPIHVPADMNVVINLAEPKKIEEQTDCLNVDTKHAYLDYYDAEGTVCFVDNMINMVLERLGCLMPVWNYFPLTNTCTFAANFLLSISVSRSGVDELMSTITKSDKPETDSLRMLNYMFSRNTPCKPLCSRWSYPVLSSSYGSIQYKDDEIRKAQTANRSWSRIRVILPQSATSHVEQKKASPYLVLCDVGGMMGVWAGFSMITFAQIGAYGFLIARFKWKKRNQVEPANKLKRTKVMRRIDLSKIDVSKMLPRVVISNEVIETEL